MNLSKGFKIIGTGKYLPANIISSDFIEQKLGLPSGWSEKYSGVKERRFTKNETNAEMAVYAIQQAMENAQIELEDIDMIISASVTFDYILPFQAALILKTIGENENFNIPTLDVSSSCLSFISALDVAVNFLDGKKYNRIAIVSSEIASVGLNPENKETSTLFGDGAAAVIIEWDGENQSGLIKSSMKTYPEGFYHSIIKGGGNKYFYKDYPYDPELHSFSMEGKKLLKLAKRKIPEFFKEFYNDLEVEMEDIDVIIPHQASKSGMAIFLNLFPDSQTRVFSNLETHGNCIAASIPMCLHDCIETGILKRDNNCLIAGTAAGFAIGGLLFKY